MNSKILMPACVGFTAIALGACGPNDKPGQGGVPATALETNQKSSHFDAVSAHLDLGGIAYGYLDIDGDAEKLGEALQGFMEMAKEASGGDMPTQLTNLNINSVLDELGLTGVEALGMSSYQNGDLYRNKFYLHVPEGRTGLLKMLGGDAAAFAAQNLAPAGTDLILEQELDLKSGFALARDLVAKVGGPKAAAEFAKATAEPMRGGPPMSLAEVFANLDTRITMVARIHPDKPMQLPDDVPFEVPGVDALIALDKVGGLFTKLIASIPEEQRAQMVQEGDGFQSITLPIPPEMAAIVQPVIRHETASGRVLVATSAAFLEECLSGKSSVWDDAGFKTAMQGLPEEGNGLSFASAQLMKEYLRIYGEAMKAMTAEGGAPAGLAESVVGLLQSMGISDKHDQATVVTNLPEGVLVVQNSMASAKQTVVMAGAAFSSAAVAGFLVPMKASRSAAAFDEEVFLEATRPTLLIEEAGTDAALPAPLQPDEDSPLRTELESVPE